MTETSPVLLPADDPLVTRLVEWRRARARDEGVPAYRVLPNAVLLELARAKPDTIKGLLDVNGIGPARAEKYGLALLDLLHDAGADGADGSL